ncbi:DUF1592 domain-containing protein [Rhodopirellula sp. JC639]|uniref:DUF1592 domain-containing protein n=1 Tax=Stieleria mannarensis TaxID=2755585 RepID=UPI001602097E|nr:DUF1592 domain-containing protein [Rhodopirellula sp. JC639]
MVRAVLLTALTLAPSLRSVADDTLGSLLEHHCQQCHGADAPEANLRLDNLDFSLAPDSTEHSAVGKLLARVYNAVDSGQMPPEDAEPLAISSRRQLLRLLRNRLLEVAKHSPEPAPHRRLTTEEYNFTLKALFDVDAEFADLLPADPISESGYRNARSQLGLSSLQVEAYLDSARRAVQRYVRSGPIEDDVIRYHIEFEDLYYATGDRYGTRKRAPVAIDRETMLARRERNLAQTPAYVDPLGPKRPGAHSDDEKLRAAIPKLNQQYVAIPRRLPTGEMVVRVRAAGAADRNGRFPRMRVEAGITLGDGCSIDKRLLGETDVTAPRDAPAVYEFRIRLEDVPTKGPQRQEETFDRLSVFDMDQIFISNVSSDPHAVFALGRGGYANPEIGSQRIADAIRTMDQDGVNFLMLDCMEIEMFPGHSESKPSYRWQIPGVAANQDEATIAEQPLAEFMRQAYRRPVTADEVAQKLKLFRSLRTQGYSFDDSVRETMAATLISPAFLFLEIGSPSQTGRQSGLPSPYQLASRLSYLLWLSPPDDRLMNLANDGSLMQPDVFHDEAERMLADPRSRRFLESFCRQWLRLERYHNIAVDRRTYPTYDDDFAVASIRETIEYFVEVFQSDSNALDLIDSDYAIVNDRLAEHYGLSTLTTGEMRRVTLPQDSVRGGLLTQASVLTLNSDGVDSHAIRRGVWLLDRMLHSPPPPPPPNVPAIEADDPDLQGLSLKEKIQRHREPGTCRNCHAKIDPWGIPFENFDATGRWRNERETLQGGKPVQRIVDSATELPDGQRIENIVALKQYLRQQRSEQLTDALVHHLLTYTLGRSPDISDRQAIDAIRKDFKASGHTLRGLVLAIVDSELFRMQ